MIFIPTINDRMKQRPYVQHILNCLLDDLADYISDYYDFGDIPYDEFRDIYEVYQMYRIKE